MLSWCGVGEAAVDGDGGAGGGTLASDKIQNGVGDMTAGDRGFQKIAAAVIFVQALLVQVSGFHAVFAHQFPQTGFVFAFGKNGVGGYHIDANVVGGKFQAGNST